ncbi:MAG: hypothetical protein ACT4OI_05200 [Methanobacteriota archaeon]
MDVVSAMHERRRLAYERRRTRMRRVPRRVFGVLVACWGVLLSIGALYAPVRDAMLAVFLLGVPTCIELFRWWIPHSRAVTQALSYEELLERFRAFRALRRPLHLRILSVGLGVLSLALLLMGLVMAGGILGGSSQKGAIFLLLGVALLAHAGLTLSLIPFYRLLDAGLLGKPFGNRGLLESTAAFGACGVSLLALGLTRLARV